MGKIIVDVELTFKCKMRKKICKKKSKKSRNILKGIILSFEEVGQFSHFPIALRTD